MPLAQMHRATLEEGWRPSRRQESSSAACSSSSFRGAGSRATLPSRQGPLLFAYLTLNRDRLIARDELIEAPWPSAIPRRPVGAHRVALEAASHRRVGGPAGPWRPHSRTAGSGQGRRQGGARGYPCGGVGRGNRRVETRLGSRPARSVHRWAAAAAGARSHVDRRVAPASAGPLDAKSEDQLLMA
jgi:hypothetical protein